MNVDWNKIYQSKQALRQRLASLPIAEKLRLLDAMREQAIAIRSSNPRPQRSGTKGGDESR